MQYLPIGVQSFERLRQDDLLYVDKTHFIEKLTRGGQIYFLSRPRRFGKSLLLSTLRAYFEGKERLFRGLYIHDKVKEWLSYPIIQIDTSAITYRISGAAFRKSFLHYLNRIAKEYELELTAAFPADALDELILKLKLKYQREVVVLVDEYDKPLVDMLHDANRFEENREILNEVYTVLKSAGKNLRFVMLTGVSRFSKVSVFSGLNNLDDISLNKNFSDIVGFTQQELLANYDDYLRPLEQQFKLERTQLLYHITTWYNGFSFDGKTKLYNPFSILKLFSEQRFSNYWFATGTPSFLLQQIKQQQKLPENFENYHIKDLAGHALHVHHIPLIPLLFQTGYLSITEEIFDGVESTYILNYPNEEVRYSFLMNIIVSFTNQEQTEVDPTVAAIRTALKQKKITELEERLQSYLSDIPARLHIPREAYYHSLVYLILRLVGFRLILEKETDKGRIDAVLELEDKIYIVEFKFARNKRIKKIDTLVKQALKQIKANRYYEPYLQLNKEVILLGIGFLNKKIAAKAETI